MNRSVIQTHDLTKRYGDTVAVAGSDLDVPRPSIFGFLGPNGAGRSTAMKLLLGLARPSSGTGADFGLDIERESLALRERVGYLAQEPRFYGHDGARDAPSRPAARLGGGLPGDRGPESREGGPVTPGDVPAPPTAPSGDQGTPIGSPRGLAVRARGLARRFGENEAVRPLDLDVAVGEIFGLLGHNGAGKTTVVRLLNGVLAPSAGEARVLGLDPTAQGTALRRRTGVSTETPSMDDRLTGRQGLAFFAELYDVPRAAVAREVERALETFGLADAGDRRVGTYSKGMRQRLALARALLHDPDLLFLDEPTSGLDPVATREVEDVIRRLGRDAGKTVVLCTHDLAQAQALCDRVAILEHGRLIALGTPAELAGRYGGAARVVLEVAPDAVREVLAVLEEEARFRAASAGEGEVLVEVAERDAVPDLVADLVAAGVRLYGVRSQRPSLEDVYFALHAGREREATR